MPIDTFKLLGTIVDNRYRIDAVVGEGAFGVVYRGFSLSFQQPVALKVLKIPPHFVDEAYRIYIERFRAEAQLLFLLKDEPNVVRVLDTSMLAGPQGPTPYLVLEWLDGATLEDLLHDRKQRGLGPMAPAEAIRFLEPAMRAVGHAHALKISHRDLKPSNLFLAQTPLGPVLKVLDFGIAKALQIGEEMTHAATGTKSAFHAFTPEYGAPEQFFSKRFGATGPWTDVHALALLLVELMTGPRALDGEDIGELLLAATSATRPTPAQRGAALSPALEAMFARALAVQPRDRFTDAGTFAHGLFEALPREDGYVPVGTLMAAPAGVLGPPTAAPFGSLSAVGAFATGPGTHAMTVAGGPLGPGGVSGTQLAVAGPPGTPQAPRQKRPGVSKLWWVFGALVWGVIGIGAVVHYGNASDPSDGDASSSGAAPLAPPEGASGGAGNGSACPSGMVKLAGGAFQMGSEDGDEDERPIHPVEVAPFCIDVTEVTVEAYGDCAKEGACVEAPRAVVQADLSPRDATFWSTLCNAGHDDRDQHPINCVDWIAADTYCRAVKKRLPTEAEWEFAAKAGPQGRRYPWGDAPPDATRLNGCGTECVALGAKHGEVWPRMYQGKSGWEGTAPVGSYPAGRSADGIDDLAGNVWEWTTTPACKYGVEKCTETSLITRGGGWNVHQKAYVRSSDRSGAPPTLRQANLGFRCASTL